MLANRHLVPVLVRIHRQPQFLYQPTSGHASSVTYLTEQLTDFFQDETGQF